MEHILLVAKKSKDRLKAYYFTFGQLIAYANEHSEDFRNRLSWTCEDMEEILKSLVSSHHFVRFIPVENAKVMIKYKKDLIKNLSEDDIEQLREALEEYKK